MNSAKKGTREMIKNNHDGTITLNANTWTSCNACGKQVTIDSIHTCSPQTLTALEVMEQTHRNISEAHLKNLFDFTKEILKKAQEK